MTASSADTSLPPAFLRTVARAVAGHFAVESNAWEKHDELPALVRVMSATIDRGDVFPRNEWKPAVGDSARLHLTYRAGDRQPDIRLARAGNPTRFERLVLRAARTALERSAAGKFMRDTLPLVAAMSGDSTVVVVSFGRESDVHSGVARFSVQETMVHSLRTNRPPRYPSAAGTRREGDVLLAFIVQPDSTPDLSTVQVVNSSGDEFLQAVLRALPTYRFVPAEIDCVTVPALVQLPFAFRFLTPKSAGADPRSKVGRTSASTFPGGSGQVTDGHDHRWSVRGTDTDREGHRRSRDATRMGRPYRVRLPADRSERDA